MEIELKYALKDDLNKEKLIEYLTGCNAVKHHMVADYLDTKDAVLNINKIALRARLEDTKYVLTIKSQGEQVNGLFKREEANIEITDNQKSYIYYLNKTPLGKKIIDIIKDKELITYVKTDFYRLKAAVLIDECTVEIALDEGYIYANQKTALINELEIEYLSGNIQKLDKINRYFADRFNLTPEVKSKYERGLELY